MANNLKENLERELGSVIKDAVEEAIESVEFGEIMGLDKIYWRAANLQDVQMMEALEAAVKKHSSLKVMQILEAVV